MIGGLEQTDSREATFSRTVHYGLHQDPSDTPVLNVRRDRDRPDPGNRGTLIQAVAANNAPIKLRDDAIEARMGEEHPEKTHSGFGRRKFRGKVVLAADRSESLVANTAAKTGVGGRRTA